MYRKILWPRNIKIRSTLFKLNFVQLNKCKPKQKKSYQINKNFITPTGGECWGKQVLTYTLVGI